MTWPNDPTQENADLAEFAAGLYNGQRNIRLALQRVIDSANCQHAIDLRSHCVRFLTGYATWSTNLSNAGYDFADLQPYMERIYNIDSTRWTTITTVSIPALIADPTGPIADIRDTLLTQQAAVFVLEFNVTTNKGFVFGDMTGAARTGLVTKCNAAVTAGWGV